MALSAQNLLDLKNADQRFRAHVALFPAWSPTITPPVIANGTGTLLTPKPMILIAPRYSTIANSGTQVLYGLDSYVRGGGASATPAFALQGGSAGSLVDHGNGTATYTAPASGNGVAVVEVSAANGNGTTTSYAHVHYAKTQYDEMVAEVATLSGNLGQHGWRATLRVRGTATDFTIGKRILLHIEDTWAGTTSTFGGYKYPEGVLLGYITEAEYFEDYAGETWLGLEVQPPWWVLTRVKMGELWWGYTSEGGKLYIANFAPVDAIWKFVQDITDFAEQHNVTMWFDQNTIDDFITEESDLAALIEDIMARTLSIAYCDRYGSLFCVPDPDVRADEYWGTPASTYTLTPDYVMSYRLLNTPYQIRKLTLAAFDASKLGIFALSENPTAPGGEQSIRGLLCDQALTLASWAVQKRAQMNRPWVLEAEHPLNHVLDINNFVDAIFTAPSQAGAPTASAQCYVDSISYRPDIANGGWRGNIRYLKRTEGDGESETGGVSGWGGTGQNWTGAGSYSGDSWMGSGAGGWSGGGGEGVATWCYLWDFANGDAGGWFEVGDQTRGVYAGGVGWSATYVTSPNWNSTGVNIQIERDFPSRTITQIAMWSTGTALPGTNAGASHFFIHPLAQTVSVYDSDVPVPTAEYIWNGSTATNAVILYVDKETPGVHDDRGIVIVSARIKGLGVNPFSDSPTGNCAY